MIGRLGVEQNKRVVRRVFDEVVNQGRFDVIPEIYSPTVVDHDPLPGTADGLEGIRESIGGLREAFPDLAVTIEDISAHGDYVVVHNTWSGTQTGRLLGLPATGRRVSFDGIVLWRLEDGLIAERWGMVDTAGMLRQAGHRAAVRSAGRRRTIRAGRDPKRQRRVARETERLIQVRPIPPGKLDDWRALHVEMEGPLKSEVDRSRRALELSKELVWYAPVGGDDFSVHLWEHDEPDVLAQRMPAAGTPFDATERERWQALGVDLASADGQVMAEKTFEWADSERLREVESFVGVVLVQPILAGQEQALADFSHQFVGPRHDEYVASRRRAMVVRDAAYEQQMSPDLRVEIVYWELVSGEGFQQFIESEDPFDRWYRERVLQQHGTDMAAIQGLPSELVFEWPPPTLAGL